MTLACLGMEGDRAFLPPRGNPFFQPLRLLALIATIFRIPVNVYTAQEFYFRQSINGLPLFLELNVGAFMKKQLLSRLLCLTVTIGLTSTLSDIGYAAPKVG